MHCIPAGSLRNMQPPLSRQMIFRKQGLASYTDHVYRVLGAELSLSHKLQKLVRYQWLFNFLMKMCSRNKQMRELISCMFYEVDIRKKLTSPVFYLKVLFNR